MSATVQAIQWTADTVSAFGGLVNVLIDVVPKVVTLSAMLAALIPPPVKQSAREYVLAHKWLNWLAFNVGRAKNQGQ